MSEVTRLRRVDAKGGGPPEPPQADGRPADDGSADEGDVFGQLADLLQRAVVVLRNQPDRSPTEVFLLVAAADDALGHAPALFEALAPLVEAARPGPYVAAELDRHRSQMNELAEKIGPSRAELNGLRESQRDLGRKAEEHGEIVRQIAELRYQSRLAQSVPELRRQAETLRTEGNRNASRVADARDALITEARKFITLSDDLLKSVDAQIRELLYDANDRELALEARIMKRRAEAEQARARADRLNDELAAAEADEAAANSEEAATKAELEQVKESITKRIADLRRYAEANRATSAALAQPSADWQGHEHDLVGMAGLDDVERRLSDIDTHLAKCLAERHDSRQEARRTRRPKSAGLDEAFGEKE